MQSSNGGTPVQAAAAKKGVRILSEGAGAKAGVNLRTLQQYELKTKDIGKASVQTVLSLVNVLGCRVEGLMEYSTEEDDGEM